MDQHKIRMMEAAAREIAALLESGMDSFRAKSGDPKRWGFALMIFSFEGPELTWISNAERADMVKAMQEFINRNPPDQTSEQRS